MDYQVLIVGGGIHGVGLLHDLSSRKIKGVHLVEKNLLASGTSSRSTKLIHGGFRYLEHLNQWKLVREALSERKILLKIIPELVKPRSFILPNLKKGKFPPWMIRTGLFVYDFFASDEAIPSAKSIQKNKIQEFAPYLKQNFIDEKVSSAFLYYDAQMIDDVIVRIVAQASVYLGATYEEKTEVIHVESHFDHYRVTLKKNNETWTVTTKVLVNACGAWNNENLIRWNIVPKISCLLNLGSHLLFSKNVFPAENFDSISATIFQENDGRVVFFIPWNGNWLLGTTESILPKEPDHVKVPQYDYEYLMNSAENYLNLTDPKKNIIESFAGVRCMPLLKNKMNEVKFNEKWKSDPFSSPFYINKMEKNISSLSRELVISENPGNIFSIYGGKFTTYRAQMEKLGAHLSRILKSGTVSKTNLKSDWNLEKMLEEHPNIFQTSKSLRQM